MPNVRQRDSKGDTSCLLDLAKKYYDRCYREKKGYLYKSYTIIGKPHLR